MGIVNSDNYIFTLVTVKKITTCHFKLYQPFEKENAKTCVRFAALDNVGIGLSVGPAKKQDWQDCIQTTLLPFSKSSARMADEKSYGKVKALT